MNNGVKSLTKIDINTNAMELRTSLNI